MIFELILAAKILFGLCLGFIVNLFNTKLRIASLIIISYLVVANQSPLLNSILKNAPETFRISNKSFRNFFFVTLLRTNDLIIVFISFYIYIIIASFLKNSFTAPFFIGAVLLAMMCLIYSEITTNFIKTKILSSIIFIIDIIFCKSLYSIMLNLISIVFLLIILKSIISSKRVYVLKSKTLKHISSSKISSEFFLRALSRDPILKIIELFILISYSLIAIKFGIDRSIFALIQVLIWIEGTLYTHGLLENSNHHSRIFFNDKSSNFFYKIIYGNFFYRIIHWFFIFLITAVILIHKGKFHIIPLVLNLLWTIMLLMYFAKIEKIVILEKKKRPMFIEDYIFIMITTGIGLV